MTNKNQGPKRNGIGETSNAGMRRMRFSERAAKGDLNVIDLRESKGKINCCPYCGHHKIFGKNKGFECTRCHRDIEV